MLKIKDMKKNFIFWAFFVILVNPIANANILPRDPFQDYQTNSGNNLSKSSNTHYQLIGTVIEDKKSWAVLLDAQDNLILAKQGDVLGSSGLYIKTITASTVTAESPDKKVILIPLLKAQQQADAKL